MQCFRKSKFWKIIFKDIFSQQSSKDKHCYSKKTSYVFTTLNKFTKSKPHKFYNAHMVEKKFHHPTRTLCITLERSGGFVLFDGAQQH